MNAPALSQARWTKYWKSSAAPLNLPAVRVISTATSKITKSDLYSFIADCKLGVISTLSSSGKVESALVGIAVTEHLEIIFDTVKSSRKYSNLISNPACSLVAGWAGEQTVQYDGCRN